MATTIIGPETKTFPRQGCFPIVYLKQNWADDWLWCPELELIGGQDCSASHGLSRIELRRRYGQIKLPWQTDLYTTIPWNNLDNWWVEVYYFGDIGYVRVFLGRISGEQRDVHGSDQGPSGEQRWIAVGPLHLLRKIPVSRSFWWVDGETKEIGWVPPLNNSDDRHGLVGNRTELQEDTTYLYAGDYLANEYIWSYKDYIEYLLHHFVTPAVEPTFTLGGQTEVLESLSEPVQFGESQTVAEILGRLIDPRLGVDYCLRPTEDGFEIHVFCLTSEAYSFGDCTLPRNPDMVRIYSSELTDNLTTRIARSADHSYDKIRVLGRRMVVCCTLYADCFGAHNPNPEGTATLEPKWSAALQTEYESTIGAEWGDMDGDGMPLPMTAANRDDFHRREKFRTVYQLLGAPHDWAPMPPLLDAAGEFDEHAYLFPLDSEKQYQHKIRRTLSWLPLRQGWDYSEYPPASLSAEGGLDDFQPPFVLVADRYSGDPSDSGYRWLLAEAAGISVSVSQTDWGFQLHAPIPHLLDYPNWLSGSDTEIMSRYCYDYLLATLAFECDQRVQITWEAPESSNIGTKDYMVSDAEFWLLAPSTVLGVMDDNPRHLRRSGAQPIVLRNDNDRLAQVMAGAIARYWQERAQATITVAGLYPWGGLLGQILTVIEEGGNTDTIQAAITEVSWRIGDAPTTTIKTGHAP